MHDLANALCIVSSTRNCPNEGRAGVFEMFERYQEAKRSHSCYDAADLVHSIHGRLQQYGYQGLPLHSMTVDEVQVTALDPNPIPSHHPRTLSRAITVTLPVSIDLALIFVVPRPTHSSHTYFNVTSVSQKH